jgi:hypothetical protein
LSLPFVENDFNHARWTHWKSTPFADGDLTPQPVKIPWVSDRREYIFPDLSLGFLFEIVEKRERCNFCRLASSTIATACRCEPESLPEQTFGDFPSHFVFCRLINRKKSFDQSKTYDLVIDLTNIKPNFLSFNQVTVHRIRDGGIPFEGRIVTPRIDCENMRKWLMRHQPGSQGPPRGAILGFRVIDVLSKNVVPITGPGGCRYLILGYVWGGPQHFQNVKAVEATLQKKGSLSQHPLPRTIQDAIHFTAEAGERYLWVDSLCIVQDDGDAKMVQINAMDKIYSCALATIVASDGTSCHDGLPGVREIPPRWKQYTAEVRGITFANKQVTHVGKERIWPTRGWTYQEHALSQRCIHFSYDGVEFESEDGLIQEDIHPPLHLPQPARAQLGFPMSIATPDAGLLSNIEIYALSMMLYSFRNLTFENDAVNAFQGVLNVHQTRFRRDFLFGMPSSELEFALLWQPGSALLRRTGENMENGVFPSWSWIAWQGKVMLPLLGPNRFSRVTWVDAVSPTIKFTSDEWRSAESEIDKWKIVPDRGDKAPWYFEENSPTTRSHTQSPKLSHAECKAVAS